MIALLTAAALFAAPAPKPDGPPEVPVTASPTFCVARAEEDGVRLTRTRLVPETRTREVTAVVNGVAIVRKVAETVLIPVTTQEMIDLKDTPVFDVKGEKVDSKTVLDRLKNGAVVLISSDGEKVAPAFLKAVMDDVLVFVPPPKPPEVKQAPAPAPDKK